MSDYALQFLAGNLLVSSLVAAMAWVVQTKLQRPTFAHVLWILALAKLLTPPLFTVPMLPLPGDAANAPLAGGTSDTGTSAAAIDVAPLASDPTIEFGMLLLALWAAGSALALLSSGSRVVRFQRLLRQSSSPAPDSMQQLAADLARRFGLRSVPAVRLTSARVAPLVWWLGGRASIFVPRSMMSELANDQQRMILAHELAHLRRGDHVVRLLEWLTCIAFWWNPIAWWTRRNLRANEEVCCDALVLRTLRGSRHTYANSLLAAVEFLAEPGIRPPAVASQIDSGGVLERRFQMIVSKTPVKTMPRWLERLLTACMVLVLPLGVAYAQTADIKAVAGRLQRAVKAGELSKKDMKVMLGALKKSTAERQPRARDARREVEPPEFDRAWFAKTKAKISGAVKDGILTEREAEKKLIELEKKAFERSGKTTRRKTRSSSRDAEMKIFEIKQWLDGAVQRGELTRQEADKKLKEVARKLTPERSANDYMDKAKSKDKAKNKDKNKSKDKAKSKAKNKGKRRAERAARKAERKDKKERRRIGEEADPTIEKVVRR